MVETAETKQVTQAASSLLFPGLEFGTAANGTYPSEDLLEVLARIAFDNEFANTGAKAYQLARGDDISLNATARNPLARALLYHLREFDADAVNDQFDRVRENVLTAAARNRVFTRPVCSDGMKACYVPSVCEEVLGWSKADDSTASQNAWL